MTSASRYSVVNWMADLDLGELNITSGSIWGAYREIRAYVIEQSKLHPKTDSFSVHAEIQGERTCVEVTKDGTLTSKEQVVNLMADWITEAKGY